MDQHPKTDSWKNSTNSLFRSYYLLFIACKSKQKSRKFQFFERKLSHSFLLLQHKGSNPSTILLLENYSPLTEGLQSCMWRTDYSHVGNKLCPRWEQKTAFKCRISVTYMAMKLRFVDEFSRKRSTPNISA